MITLYHFLLTFLLLVCLVTFLGIPLTFYYFRKVFRERARKNKRQDYVTVAFFHPYCNDGGGGERVLWTAVHAILHKYPKTVISIYTGDLEYAPTEILSRVKQRFNIVLPNNINFIYLRRRKWIEAETFPYFTLVGQSIGSIWLGFEALMAYQPDVYIDSMGYSFTYPLFKYIGHCKVGCYTHYPTITSDMSRRVTSRVATYNNHPSVANSPFFTAGKLCYYKIFAKLYGIVGRCADITMVNSSWTEDHINELWKSPLTTHLVYPPCDVEDLKTIQRNLTETLNSKSVIKIVSVGQFRPEKNHPLQLRAMYELRQIVSEAIWDKIALVFIGACRNEEDSKRVVDMEDLCKHLSLENNVEFKINVSYKDLKKELADASIGLHAMWNEHFGIGVVECMAAGLVTIAHCSGGPKSDIIIESEGSRNGFLANDDDEYAHAIATIISMSAKQREGVIQAARSSVDRFSSKEFEKNFLRSIDPMLKPVSDAT